MIWLPIHLRTNSSQIPKYSLFFLLIHCWGQLYFVGELLLWLPQMFILTNYSICWNNAPGSLSGMTYSIVFFVLGRFRCVLFVGKYHPWKCLSKIMLFSLCLRIGDISSSLRFSRTISANQMTDSIISMKGWNNVRFQPWSRDAAMQTFWQNILLAIFQHPGSTQKAKSEPPSPAQYSTTLFNNASRTFF